MNTPATPRRLGTALAGALDDQLRLGVTAIGQADLVVGVPSYQNSATVGHVVRCVAAGLREHFAQLRVVIVNADGGSQDGTPDRVREAAGDISVISGAYRGPAGKGTALRAVFEVAGLLEARACAVVDSDLRSIAPVWVEQLLGPILRDEADYVAPLYIRDKHDGTITNSIVYPLTRALYGLRVRQPIGGEFGFSGELARSFVDSGDWEGDIARFGIDIHMTTTAILRRARIVQAPLGAKIHDPKDPAADLGPMFVQVVGTALHLAATHADAWSGVRGSASVPLTGDPGDAAPDAIGIDVPALIHRFRSGAAAEEDRWAVVLDPRCARAVRRALTDDAALRRLRASAWARIVYDFVVAARREPARSQEWAGSLLPLYFAWVAAFAQEVFGFTPAAAEAVIEQHALSFEAQKAHALR